MKVVVAVAACAAGLAQCLTFATGAAAQSCHMIAGTDKTCTQSYTSCITKNDRAKCRATRDSCLKTGRWIWRRGSECWDWGSREKS
jgi:hypothetical protein